MAHGSSKRLSNSLQATKKGVTKMPINIEDLDSETIRNLGLQKPKKYSFLAEHERQFAIRVLNVISGLKQNERNRVLRRAIKMNEA
jgi:hypothetical protein